MRLGWTGPAPDRSRRSGAPLEPRPDQHWPRARGRRRRDNTKDRGHGHRCHRRTGGTAGPCVPLAAGRILRRFPWGTHLGADAAEPGGTLAVCHGAAGVLAIADAFARHAGLSEAAALGDRLEGYLLDHSDEMASWPLSLHHGSGGVLAVLIT